MPRTEHSGNQEFGPLTPPSGKRRKRRSVCVCVYVFEMVYKDFQTVLRAVGQDNYNKLIVTSLLRRVFRCNVRV